ncbi:MAG: alpha-galactosidase [Bacteroidales bacterium]|nr:alpha-galactosidase [Bacteroidales bacterium]MBN2634571.1 alpha-galactosidase [Bacteroidales bacterium]
MKQSLLLILLVLVFPGVTYCQLPDKCQAGLSNDTLTLKNDVVFAKYLWNNGNLIRLAFGDISSGRSVILADTRPNVALASTGSGSPVNGTIEISEVDASPVRAAHLSVTVISSDGHLSVKRVFRIFPGCPAFGCELWLKGKYTGTMQASLNQGDLRNIESEEARLQEEVSRVTIDLIKTEGMHWEATSAEFFDITDRNNTLVQEYRRLVYRQETQMRGNLLLLENKISGDRLFMLKEAPASSVQLNYPGYDFTVKHGEVKATGMGITPSDINDSGWTRVYSVATGLALSDDAPGLLLALRKYQMTQRLLIPGRDEMILMNTWGDRSQDKRVGEAFAMAELEAGARLGITHFQLDDGWQTGRSANSAFKGGSFDNIWRNPDYWKPDPVKFPRGLSPVVEKGRQLGIEVCVWFNPSPDDGNINWEKDADALTELYNKYGIRTFKIDGVKLPDKKSEVNFRSFLDKVVRETKGNAVFNLDVTAGRRAGYHYFTEYGNLFLENRYTDWKNYYPYQTLRNLWMLSKYVPAQKLQIEFLNIWRNQANYKGDPFGPANYSFDYVFAITMMAQPLAWFEGTGLPEEAFRTADLIKKYRSIQSDIHSGTILPAGEEPDGSSWTGFQSLKGNEGYMLVFRERNSEKRSAVRTWFSEGDGIRFERVLGAGKTFSAKAGRSGEITFELDKPDSFCLFRYAILK